MNHGDSSRDLLGMVTSRDPKSKAIGDLQRSGIKRSRLESPGILNKLSFICYFQLGVRNRIPNAYLRCILDHRYSTF